MYRTHIEFEDKVLFPLAARVLSPAQSAEIAQEMEKRRNLSSFAVQGLQPRDDGGNSTFSFSEIGSESCSGGTK
jgi:hypothetical protein